MSHLLKSLNGERLQIIGVVLAAFVAVWIYSCRSTTQSLLNPPARVSRGELAAEVEMFNARLLDRVDDLDRQDAFKEIMFEQLSLIGKTGTVNPVGILSSLGLIIGIGAIGDNVRKRKEIKTLKAPP